MEKYSPWSAIKMYARKGADLFGKNHLVLLLNQMDNFLMRSCLVAHSKMKRRENKSRTIKCEKKTFFYFQAVVQKSRHRRERFLILSISHKLSEICSVENLGVLPRQSSSEIQSLNTSENRRTLKAGFINLTSLEGWLFEIRELDGGKKIAKPPVIRRKISAVTGVSYKFSSGYLRFSEN